MTTNRGKEELKTVSGQCIKNWFRQGIQTGVVQGITKWGKKVIN